MECDEVGVACDSFGGWNGVGVDEAFGAAVIKTKGRGAGASDGAIPQDVSKKATISARPGNDVFVIDWPLEMQILLGLDVVPLAIAEESMRMPPSKYSLP